MYDNVMKRIVVLVSSLSVFGLGCARSAVVPAVTLAKPEVVKTSNALPVEGVERDMSLRKSGDYVVYRFSGSYRDNPVTMTQQVVSVRDGKSVLDLIIDDGRAQLRLRMRLDGDNNLLSVAKLDGIGLVARGQEHEEGNEYQQRVAKKPEKAEPEGRGLSDAGGDPRRGDLVELVREQGFEGPWKSQWEARLSYTLTLSRFRESFESDNPLFGSVEVGDHLPYLPTHQGAAGLSVTRIAMVFVRRSRSSIWLTS